MDVDEVPLVAVDFETTGLDPRKHEIVSAGWVRLEGGRILLESAARWDLRPETPMSPASVAIHGISDDRAAQGAPLSLGLEQLLSVLAGSVLVAHNARLEAAFLDAACQRCYSAHWAGPCIDTLAVLERTLRQRQQPVPEGTLRLAAARRRYGLPVYPEHDALSDAIAAAELWLAISRDLRGDGTLPLERVRQILP
jgi:DNA polymerase-3 subunit epsilon